MSVDVESFINMIYKTMYNSFVALKKLDVPSADNYSRQYLHTTRYAAGLSQFKKELQIQSREPVVPGIL